jgi:hypothetical protein
MNVLLLYGGKVGGITDSERADTTRIYFRIRQFISRRRREVCDQARLGRVQGLAGKISIILSFVVFVPQPTRQVWLQIPIYVSIVGPRE